MTGAAAERLSIIVPVLNEAPRIKEHPAALRPLRQRGHEVIVIDGGSPDGSLALAKGAANHACVGPRGRARQMNLGASRASGEVLLFLHADTALPPDADTTILLGLELSGRSWDRFDVTLSGKHAMLAVIARCMNLRSRLTGIATGDQALFVRRASFARVGGFPDQPLMEDIEISKRLKRTGPPLCLRERVITSGRHWETNGVWRTIALMWRLRWLYWRGEDPERLARRYR